MSFLRFLLRRHPVAAIVFGLAFAGLVAFSTGFVREALYFNDPAHRNQTLEGWMTPRYVSMSWDLPPEVIGPIMGIDRDAPHDGRPPRLSEIAASQGLTLAELQARVEAAKATFDAERQARHGGPDKGPGQ